MPQMIRTSQPLKWHKTISFLILKESLPGTWTSFFFFQNVNKHLKGPLIIFKNKKNEYNKTNSSPYNINNHYEWKLTQSC